MLQFDADSHAAYPTGKVTNFHAYNCTLMRPRCILIPPTMLNPKSRCWKSWIARLRTPWNWLGVKCSPSMRRCSCLSSCPFSFSVQLGCREEIWHLSSWLRYESQCIMFHVCFWNETQYCVFLQARWARSPPQPWIYATICVPTGVCSTWTARCFFWCKTAIVLGHTETMEAEDKWFSHVTEVTMHIYICLGIEWS